MAGRTLVLVTRPWLGTVSEADRDFGIEMMDKFLHSLEPEDHRPEVLCLYTEGVRLVTESSPARLGLELLAGLGVRIVACQSCLEYYGLTDQVVVGDIGNMKEIVGLLMSANRVITI